MQTTMEQLKRIIDVNTIVGTPVQTNVGSVIIPVSKVSFGFASGGGEYAPGEITIKSKQEVVIEEIRNPFAGGSGAGVSLSPVAFLVLHEDNVKMLPVNYTSTLDRIVENIPVVINELKSALGQKNERKEAQERAASSYAARKAAESAPPITPQ
jgi:sporulation protein YtfJ